MTEEAHAGGLGEACKAMPDGVREGGLKGYLQDHAMVGVVVWTARDVQCHESQYVSEP